MRVSCNVVSLPSFLLGVLNEPAPLLLPAPEIQLPTWRDAFALRVVQIGAVLSVVVATASMPFELDRFYVPKEAVLHATAFLAGLLLLPSLRRLSFTRVDVWLSLFALAGGVSALLATNGWNASRSLALTASGLLLYACARALGSAGYTRALLNGMALAVVVACATALVQAYGVEAAWFSRNRMPGGTLGNRNAIGHLAVLGLPLVALVALDARRVRTFALGASGVMLCMTALVLTRSRAAWLALAIVAVVLVVGVVLIAFRHHARTLPLRGLALLALMTVGVGAALVLPNALQWRSDTPYLETARSLANHREGSGRGRLVQYKHSLAMTLHHPVFGVGPGNWPVEYPGHAARRDPSLSGRNPGMTANPWPSSDLVAMVSERGLLGTALAGLAFLLLGWTTLQGVWRATTPEGALGALVLVSMWIGTLVAGAFDAVLLLPWPLLVVATATGALWASDTLEPIALRGALRWALLVALVVATGTAMARSAMQVRAMQVVSESPTPADLLRATHLDPGNYRIHMRLAQRGNRQSRCVHAVAASELYPHSVRAAQAARRCR